MDFSLENMSNIILELRTQLSASTQVITKLSQENNDLKFSIEQETSGGITSIEKI